MTSKLFRGPVTVKKEPDPELPVEYLVVYATVQGGVDELVELNRQWHATIRNVAGDRADQYRLTFEFA
jgi:hypothetical protein